MITLYHHPYSAACRFIRLILAEQGLEFELIEERAWERRPEFLSLVAEGTVPALIENNRPPIIGASVIMEYLNETHEESNSKRQLLSEDPEIRAETRRLVNWFLHKFDSEVGRYLFTERVQKLQMTKNMGGGEPDSEVLKVARANLRHHLRYIGYLSSSRNWLAGPLQSYADFIAAAQLSTADYFGEVPWDEDDSAKAWYARIKSRPSFRELLNDRLPGIPASNTYTDLDF